MEWRGWDAQSHFQKANKPFILFEASERFGGRVHSYQRKGLTVDRGFQVLLPHYPTCQKLLDYNKLDLCYYLVVNHYRSWFKMVWEAIQLPNHV